MKKRLLILATTLVSLPVLTMGAVQAVSTDANSPSAKQSTLADRLKARQDALKLSLTTAEQNIIKARCVFAQTRITTVKTRIDTVKTTRAQVYLKIETDLTDISAKLKAKGLDTKMLDAQIATFKTKVATFDTSLTEFKQAIDDLSDMDCKSDPVDFKSSLETARTLRLTVFTNAEDARTYLTGTIRPTLVAFKAKIDVSTTDTSKAGN